MADQKSKITLSQIHAGYDDKEILKGVSFDVAAGEFVGIVGPNGCGKTTLLRTISRSLRPSSGQILLDDKNVYSVAAREFARKVGVVPQETWVAFDFTVLEVVMMGRTPWLNRFAVESKRDRQIALEALDRTGTGNLRDRQANALSGGERQRVILARALAQEPDILLLDEPTSHLDINYQFETMDLVRSLNRKNGLTVLAVLHDLNLAAQYCDRIFMLGDGVVKAQGTPEQVITPENILNVYGAVVWVRKHPATHRPYVISGIKTSGVNGDDGSMPVVHVIGGGGTGAPLMAKLVRLGYRVTCGVLIEGDADHEVAEALGIDNITLPPFSLVDEQAYKLHLEMISKADVVVLADVPMGHGNLLNITAAQESLSLSKKLLVIRPESAALRDFTDGKGVEMLEKLLAGGADSVSGIDDIISRIKA